MRPLSPSPLVPTNECVTLETPECHLVSGDRRGRSGCCTRVHRRRKDASRRTRHVGASRPDSLYFSIIDHRRRARATWTSARALSANVCHVCHGFALYCVKKHTVLFCCMKHKRVWRGTCSVWFLVACESNRDAQRTSPPQTRDEVSVSGGFPGKRVGGTSPGAARRGPQTITSEPSHIIRASPGF